MLEEISIEVYWLVLTILMTAIMWVPYVVNRIIEMGVVPAFMDRYGVTEAKAAWANRMMAAHVNAVENLVLFAPLVILVVMFNAGTADTALAVQIYFFARLAHFLLFTFATALLRVVSFLVGFGAEMVLVMALIGG
jgi:uncharacterized MAPEG superfamily protein